METHVEIRWPGIPNWHPTHYGYDVVCGYDKREIDDAGAIVRCAMWRDGAYVAGPQQGAGPEAGKACEKCGRTMQDHFSTLYDHDFTVTAAGPKPAPGVVPLVYHKTPATVAPEVAPVHVIPYPKLEPGFYGPGIGEMLGTLRKEQYLNHETGGSFAYKRVGNLTALDAIRSRKKPDPWIPSIDDWDLLPDQ